VPDDRPATRRILDGARRLLARGGAGEISVGDVAREAGISKALIHYHFRDKESLLMALVDDVGLGFLSRARAHDPRSSASAGHVLDDYWTFVADELRRGDLRMLMSLGEFPSERVRAGSRRMAEQRREVAADHVAGIFDRLELIPRVPPALVADTLAGFLEGLAVTAALEPDRNCRPAFDVLWLALLTLAE